MELELNKIYFGFKFISFEYVEEINSTVRLFVHQNTGARFLNILNEDENNVFAVSFRTPSLDSTGAAHILEHSVLCGSKKYPIKDPFAYLLKSSITTFLNAFTYSDKTMYPFATNNKYEFKKILDIYLDAVFNPNLLKDKRIFQQ